MCILDIWMKLTHKQQRLEFTPFVCTEQTLYNKTYYLTLTNTIVSQTVRTELNLYTTLLLYQVLPQRFRINGYKQFAWNFRCDVSFNDIIFFAQPDLNSNWFIQRVLTQETFHKDRTLSHLLAMWRLAAWREAMELCDTMWYLRMSVLENNGKENVINHKGNPNTKISARRIINHHTKHAGIDEIKLFSIVELLLWISQ